MTLTEVLVTLVISMALCLASFALVDVTLRRTSEINSRVDGVQRGRVAMDLMTRQLRSQVCLGASAPVSRSVVAGSATSITFYAELGNPSTPGSTTTAPPRIVEKRSLTLETTGAYAPGTLVERRWVGTPSTSDPLGFTFSGTAQVRELLRPVVLTPTPGKEERPPALFRYYGWNTTTPSNPTLDSEITLVGSNVLSDAEVKRVGKIELTFRAKPRKNNVASTVFYNDVTLRTVDPNAPTGELNVPCL